MHGKEPLQFAAVFEWYRVYLIVSVYYGVLFIWMRIER